MTLGPILVVHSPGSRFWQLGFGVQTRIDWPAIPTNTLRMKVGSSV